MRFRFFVVLAFLFLVSAERNAFACEKVFDPSRIPFKPGTRIEVNFSMNINPDHSIVFKYDNKPDYLVHYHRLNGEDFPFIWPRGAEFAEGATSWDTDFFVRFSFTIFEPGMRWTFFPEHDQTTQWKSVLQRLDKVVDLELENGAIDQRMANFCKDYHHSIVKRNVSHIFLQGPPEPNAKGEAPWETISIVHGGMGGGMYPGPWQDPRMRHPEKPSRLQIEESFPELVLPERAKYGDEAEIYEFVRLASIGQNSISSLDQVAPVIARHLVQKNGGIPSVNETAAIYFLAPTKAHERHYNRFFKARDIPIEKIADVGPGYKVYRVPLLPFIRHYLNIQFYAITEKSMANSYRGETHVELRQGRASHQ